MSVACDLGIKIVVVAGVVQKEDVRGQRLLMKQGLRGCGMGTVVGLRVAEWWDMEQGTMDPGPRLFNTTHLDWSWGTGAANRERYCRRFYGAEDLGLATPSPHWKRAKART